MPAPRERCSPSFAVHMVCALIRGEVSVYNMSEVNLSEFHGALAETFRRYLFTLNFLPDGERELRDAFWTALQAKDVFYRDPLLSIIPAYRQGKSTSALFGRKQAPYLH